LRKRVEKKKDEVKKKVEEKKKEIPVITHRFGKGKEEVDLDVQNFEKEIMKKLRANKNNNKNDTKNKPVANPKPPEKTKPRLEDKIKLDNDEGLSKEESVIQYLIQSLDTSNISNLLSRLAPPDDSKKKYARRNKKSLFQVTDANGKKNKNGPQSQAARRPL